MSGSYFSVFFQQIIFHAAVLGTAPAVSAAVTQDRRNVTLAGITDTQCTMNEYLDADLSLTADVSYFLN